MKLMGIDYGDARVGVALSDEMQFLVGQTRTIFERNRQKVIEQIANICATENVEKIILGYPKNMNGTIGERAQKTEHFKAELEQNIKIPVILWDERASTIEASKILTETHTFGKKRKEKVDAVAAAVILQSYLDVK